MIFWYRISACPFKERGLFLFTEIKICVHSCGSVCVCERESVFVCFRNTETFQRKVQLPITVVSVVIPDSLVPFVFLSFPSPSLCPRCWSEKRSKYNDAQFTALPASLTHTLMPTLITDPHTACYSRSVSLLALVPSPFPLFLLFFCNSVIWRPVLLMFIHDWVWIL